MQLELICGRFRHFQWGSVHKGLSKIRLSGNSFFLADYEWFWYCWATRCSKTCVVRRSEYVVSGTYLKQPFVDGGPIYRPNDLSLMWHHESKPYIAVSYFVLCYGKVQIVFYTSAVQLNCLCEILVRGKAWTADFWTFLFCKDGADILTIEEVEQHCTWQLRWRNDVNFRCTCVMVNLQSNYEIRLKEYTATPKSTYLAE